MKKIAYQTPEVKVKALFMESLMQGSGVTGRIDDNPTFGSGGSDNDGTMDPEAKNFSGRSVWDD